MRSRKKAKAAEKAAAAAAAIEAAKEAASKKAAKKKRLTFGRLITLALFGGVAALAASEPLRSKVLDVLFGAEEEFQYTPPVSTAPAEPSVGPAPSVGAA
jgi:hypothetical protein